MRSMIGWALVVALAAGCSNTGLVRATDATPTPTSTATGGKVGSPDLLVIATSPATTTATTRPPSNKPLATRPAQPSPKAAPTGRVLIDSFKRRPRVEQTSFGCDRLLVTLVNRSTAAVASVSVGFVTYWYRDSEIGSGDNHKGRNVALTRKVAIAVGAKKQLAFDVCLPEHNTKNVFAEPVSTSWVWARS